MFKYTGKCPLAYPGGFILKALFHIYQTVMNNFTLFSLVETLKV